MIQKKLTACGIEDFKDKLASFIEDVRDIEYSELVVGIYFANTPEEDVLKIQDIVRENFKNPKFTGMSSGGLLGFYKSSCVIILNFTFMNCAKATALYRKFDRSSKTLVQETVEFAKLARQEILKLTDVKAVEIYFAWIKASASTFIDVLSEGLEDIPIFGAIANANAINNINDLVASNNMDTTVVCDEGIVPGISMMVYSGDDLYVYCEYVFGWEPIGRNMDVVACEITDQGGTALCSIDGKKPTEVYEKYLGVRADAAFVHNICEFPLIIERDGVYIGRTPSGYSETGEVFLEGDVLPGEKVRFSYGEYEDILTGTKNAAMRMAAFGPESLSLVICGNRIIFLQSDYMLEMEYYAEGRKESPMPILGMGEIYRYKGKGGVLNSALVATGMKEGLGGQTTGQIIEIHASHHHEDFVPLSERLSHFLKEITKELADALEEARYANMAKSAFLSSMSHEIRTPINAVLGMDEMILRESSESNILEYAQSIRSAGNSLLGIVNDILDFSKIEAGKMEIVPVEYDIASVLNDLVNMVKKRADEKNLKLIVEVDPKIPHLLFGDEIRIKQVVTNILTNAVKYTEKGSITLSVSVRHLDKDDIVLRYCVKDTGIGIKQEDLPKLFSAFERIEEKRNRTIEGTGLGMSITQNLLLMMGSSLEVESIYGQGSEFYFDIHQKVIDSIPLGDFDEALKRSISSRKEYKESFTAPDARVLVVDDTSMNLTVIANLLKKTLVQIDTADSGDECIYMMRKKKYDLVFLDHRMPGKDGIETLECVKSDGTIDNSIPVIALTANAVSGSRDFYMKAGFSDYLSKPIDPDILEGIMIKFLPKEKVNLTREEAGTNETTINDEIIPEVVRNCEKFDIEAGVKNCGSEDMYVDALRAYYESADDNLKLIKEHYESGNLADYTTKVHALKSSSRIVGLNALGELAYEMEKAGNEHNATLIKEKTNELLRLYKEVTDILRTAFDAGDEEAEKEIIQSSKLIEAYGAMKEMAQMYDYDSILMILDSVSKFSVPKEEKDRFEALKLAVRNADWDKIHEILG